MRISTAQRGDRIEMLINNFAQGIQFITDAQEPLEDMTKHELVQLTKQFARQLAETPDDDVLRAKSWAVLNELILRSTGQHPTLADIRPVLLSEIEMTAEHGILHLSKRDVSTGEGKSNYWSVFLAMLRCLLHPTRTLDVVSLDLNEIPSDFHQRMLVDAEPCLNALEILPQEVSHRVHWITPNEARLVTQAYRFTEDMGDDSDREDMGDDSDDDNDQAEGQAP